MIRCAGLVHLDSTKSKMLLVKARDNKLFYLAGGKIELNELPEEALTRELAEELDIQILPETIKHITTINAPAYPQNDTVELHCYTANWHGNMQIQAEISHLEYISLTDIELMAPAVQKLVQLLNNMNLNTINE